MDNFNENFYQDLNKQEMDHHAEQEMDHHVEQEMDHHVEQEMDHHVEQEMDHRVEQEMDHNNKGKLFDLPIGSRLFENDFDQQLCQEKNNYREVHPEEQNLIKDPDINNDNTNNLSLNNKIVWDYYPSEPYMENHISEKFLNKRINSNKIIEKTRQVTESIKNKVNSFKDNSMEKIKNNSEQIFNKLDEEKKDLTDYIEENTNTIIIIILILLILSFIFYKF